MNLFFNILIPVAVMIGLNVCIYHTMKKVRGFETNSPNHPEHQQNLLTAANGDGHKDNMGGMRRTGGVSEELKKRDAKYTRASIAMVGIFIMSSVPRLILNSIELIISVEDFPEVSNQV